MRLRKDSAYRSAYRCTWLEKNVSLEPEIFWKQIHMNIQMLWIITGILYLNNMKSPHEFQITTWGLTRYNDFRTGKILHQFMTWMTNLTFIELPEVYEEHLWGVWHASKESLLLWIPVSVIFRDLHMLLLLRPVFFSPNLSWFSNFSLQISLCTF